MRHLREEADGIIMSHLREGTVVNNNIDMDIIFRSFWEI